MKGRKKKLTERELLDRVEGQQAEIERLRGQLREIAKDCGRPDSVHPHSAVRVMLGRLRADNERLKAALREAGEEEKPDAN